MKLLEVTNLNKSFKDFQAVKDLSFSVNQGDIYGFLGPNGAGKSTLIKILAGAIHADSGEIVIAGRAVDHPTPAEMHDYGIAVIYQELMLAPHLTVAENLFLGRLPRRPLGIID